jgi:hypothetical protein
MKFDAVYDLNGTSFFYLFRSAMRCVASII